MTMLEQRIQQQFFESADLCSQAAEALSRPVAQAAQALWACLTGGGKLLAAGSDVGAALAPVICAAFTGRFERERPELARNLRRLGYLGLIAAWSQRADSRLRAFLVRAGGGSLTAYLLQGLLMSLVFSGYGLGLIGKLGAAAYISIGAAAGVLSLLFVGWWRGRHALGPVEMLLRRWVYLGEGRGGG